MAKIAFYGLRRSGNHAVLEWLLRNLGGTGDRIEIKPDRIYRINRACYINEGNTYPNIHALTIDHTFLSTNFEHVIVSYEDVSDQYDLNPTIGYQKVAVIRDIPELFASRFKRAETYRDYPGVVQAMSLGQETIQTWKDLSSAESRGVILIQFERWVESKEYRNQISSRLGIKNLDVTDSVTHFGDGSSFSGQVKPTLKELKTRSQQIKLPEEVLRRIETPEVTRIRRRLGYLRSKDNAKEIIVLGDSHAQVFDAYQGCDHNFKTTIVHGATARGAINPNTKTNALQIFRNVIQKQRAEEIIIQLGEVDCGYLAWYNQKFKGENPVAQVTESLKRLLKFVEQEVEPKFAPEKITLMASSMPTIEDNTKKEFLGGARSQVDTSIDDRIELTKKYNSLMQGACSEKGYHFIDITEEVFDSQRNRVRPQYLNEQKWDHHLNPRETLPLVLNRLRK